MTMMTTYTTPAPAPAPNEPHPMRCDVMRALNLCLWELLPLDQRVRIPNPQKKSGVGDMN